MENNCISVQDIVARVSFNNTIDLTEKTNTVQIFDLSKNLHGKALELYYQQLCSDATEGTIDEKAKLYNVIVLFKTSDDVECLRTDLSNDLQILADNGIWFGGTLSFSTITTLALTGPVQKYFACAYVGIHPSIKSTVVRPGVSVRNEDGVLTRWGIIKNKCSNLRCEAFDL